MQAGPVSSHKIMSSSATNQPLQGGRGKPILLENGIHSLPPLQKFKRLQRDYIILPPLAQGAPLAGPQLAICEVRQRNAAPYKGIIPRGFLSAARAQASKWQKIVLKYNIQPRMRFATMHFEGRG